MIDDLRDKLKEIADETKIGFANIENRLQVLERNTDRQAQELKTLNERHEEFASEMIGKEGRPSLVTRVFLLEQTNKWLTKIVWAGVLALIGALAELAYQFIIHGAH